MSLLALTLAKVGAATLVTKTVVVGTVAGAVDGTDEERFCTAAGLAVEAAV